MPDMKKIRGVMKEAIYGKQGSPKDKKAAAKKKASAPKKETKTKKRVWGAGSSKTIEYKGKKMANVTKEQLAASGLSLRAYMNQWNKTGKRPSAKKK
jgi:hypothetical protein